VALVLKPNLYRVGAGVLVIASLSNVMLLWLSSDSDVFANIVAVTSGLVAVVLLASLFVEALVRWREEAVLVSFVVWLANLIEFATQSGVRWESQVRQCGFYLAFAMLALGVYVAERLERVEGGSP
jgi:hypothetical protein